MGLKLPLKVLIEPSSLMHLVGWTKTEYLPMKAEFFRIALFYDEMLCDARIPRDILEAINGSPFARVRDVSKDIFSIPSDLDVGLKITFMQSALKLAEREKAYFYAIPSYSEDVLRVCAECCPEYLETLERSLLLNDVIRLVFREYLPLFDPQKSNLSEFGDFKEGFQNGILEMAKEFKSKHLSREDEECIRRRVNREISKLKEFLKPEKLKKLGISVCSFIELAKELRKIRELNEANLSFALSLLVLAELAKPKQG